MGESFKVDVYDFFKDRLEGLRGNLQDPIPLIKRLGAMGVASAQRAFKDQALGDIGWPARYEGMEPPFINIAGALQDFNAGRKRPKPNRFVDRPALIDEGARGGLLSTLTFKTLSPVQTQWGSDKPYAGLMQEGGPSRVFVTPSGAKLAEAWLESPAKNLKAPASDVNTEYDKLRKKYYQDVKFRTKVDKTVKLKGTGVRDHLKVLAKQSIARRQKSYSLRLKQADPSVYRNKLAGPIQRRVHNLNVAPRPFLGITDALEEDMIKEVQRFFEGRGRKSEGGVA